MAGDGHEEVARGYQAIADRLREQIRSGEFASGSLLPTEKEFQEHFNVSRSTVRRALAALVESGWAVAKPNRGVEARMGRVADHGGNLAFIDHADLVNEKLFFELSRQLQRTGFHLIHVDSRVFGVEGAVEYAASKGFAGAFIWSKAGFVDVERIRAAQQHIPIIATDHGLRGVPTDLITEDNFGGARQVVSHLASLGRQRIAVSGMMDMLEINHERFSGYLQGMFGAGQAPTPRNFLFCATSGPDRVDVELLAHRLGADDRPDAVFVLQEMFVPAVVEAIFDAGLRVPDDIAVVAFGGEFPIQIDQVGLTTVAIDWSMFASSCIGVMKRRLRSPTLPYEQIPLPVSLVVRGSCGAPSDSWTPYTPTDEFVPGSRQWLQRDYLQIRSDSVRRPALVGRMALENRLQ